MIEVRADVEVHLWCSTRLGFMIKTPHCLHFEESFSILSYFMVVGFVKFSVVFFVLRVKFLIQCQFAAVVLYGLDTQYLVTVDVIHFCSSLIVVDEVLPCFVHAVMIIKNILLKTTKGYRCFC